MFYEEIIFICIDSYSTSSQSKFGWPFRFLVNHRLTLGEITDMLARSVFVTHRILITQLDGCQVYLMSTKCPSLLPNSRDIEEH